MTGYNIINLNDMLNELGEERVKSILFTYSCPLNKDIEDFLRDKAIVFTKQGIAKTHLVFASYKSEPVLIGYFTLASKMFMIKKDALSNTLRKKIAKHGAFNRDLRSYMVGAPLIAQLGKNYSNGYEKLIRGEELLKMACDKVKLIQSQIGGKFVYLECEDVDYLIDFYSDHGFVNFGERALDEDEKGKFKTKYLVQMLKYLK